MQRSSMNYIGSDKLRSAPFQPVQAADHSQKWLLVKLFIAMMVLGFLVFYRLTDFPVTWFDEGSHLHVPKTLVQHGVYADISSDGYRYFGPTVGVGPTVLLPIAGVFKLFGIGLFQARVVMALYLLVAVAAFYALGYVLGGKHLALVAVSLLLVTPGIAFLAYGRQVLGEVPGLAFMLIALWLWFRDWGRPHWGYLLVVGLGFGLAMVTKNQYLLILGPGLLAAWVLNLLYFRTVPQRVFLIPGIVAALCFAGWQLYMVFYLGPATAQENWEMLRAATAGAALVFSPQRMRQSLTEILSMKVFLATLLPALIYGGMLSLPRRKSAQPWSILMLIIGVNLVWYVVASIGWLRYAFPGLALSCLVVGRFWLDLIAELRRLPLRSGEAVSARLLAWTASLWLALMLVVPLLSTLADLIAPPANAPIAMASYLDANVPKDSVIETWEPELGFLTDHRYHYPPSGMLNQAVGYIWLNGPPPAESYRFWEADAPKYVVVGEFGRWVEIYPEAILKARYMPIQTIGGYTLYQRR